MKRKSILILIAALVLAVSIPAMSLAAGRADVRNNVSLQALDDTGTMNGRGFGSENAAVNDEPGDRLMLQDCDLEDEDCDCDAQGTGIGADGEAQHLYGRGLGDGTAVAAANVTQSQSRSSQSAAGMGRGRRN